MVSTGSAQRAFYSRPQPAAQKPTTGGDRKRLKHWGQVLRLSAAQKEKDFEAACRTCCTPSAPVDQSGSGAAHWSMNDAEDALLQRSANLFRDGTTVRGAAEDLGISRGKAERLKKKAQEAGLLP